MKNQTESDVFEGAPDDRVNAFACEVFAFLAHEKGKFAAAKIDDAIEARLLTNIALTLPVDSEAYRGVTHLAAIHIKRAADSSKLSHQVDELLNVFKQASKEAEA